jgi:hypothetical protein
MSKNLTRKGLALGALVGLVSTAVAGTPAFAADEVTFALSSGTVYAAPVDDTLTLNAGLAPAVPAANIAQLKYRVVTDGSLIAKVVITSAGAANTAVFTKTGSTTGVGATNFANVLTSVVYTPTTTPTVINPNTIAVSVDSVADATTATTGVAPSATTATKSVTVTAFIDSNSNGAVDTGE